MFSWLFGPGSARKLHRALFIKAIDHGANVQLLCSDERGLLSVYLDRKPFKLFEKALNHTLKKPGGTMIWFDQEIVQLDFSRKYFRRKNPSATSLLKYPDMIFHPHLSPLRHP